MNAADIKDILKTLEDHEGRLCYLERSAIEQMATPRSGKQKTLREFVKGKKFKNGQQQIATIVGYYEQLLSKPIHFDDIKVEWVNTKMTNKYDPNFLMRAKDDLIRVHPDGTCDLTQTGEDFFEEFLKNEPTK